MARSACLSTYWRVVKRALLAGAALVAILAAAIVLLHRERPGAEPVAAPLGALPPDSAIAGYPVAVHAVGQYEIRLLRDTAARDEIVDIHRSGRRVFARRAPNMAIALVGRDLSGDGVPDLVVSEFTGGAHCCTHALLLSLGEELSMLGAVDAGHGEVDFDDVDGDGKTEARVGDWRFAYWRDVPFSETPVPEVLLRLSTRGFEPACDLMRMPPPTEAALARRAREMARGWTSGDPPVELWGHAVDLVYAGNAAAAWRLLELAWPADHPGKDEFVADLRARLRGSPCWSGSPELERAAGGD
jgi:hypothetical protein